jgi:hypothetical protein
MQRPFATRATPDVTDPAPDTDPPPLPPERPEPSDCCQGGCDRCVYDLHEEAMDRYRAALRDWQQRQAAK